MAKRTTLIQARTAAGMSQDDLARLCGVSRWTINRIERGERNPSLELMGKIASATKGVVDLEAFLDEPSNTEAAE